MCNSTHGNERVICGKFWLIIDTIEIYDHWRQGREEWYSGSYNRSSGTDMEVPENMPPPPLRNGHRSTRSQEEEQEKGGRRVGGLDDTLDIFADPQPVRRPPGQHRQRRNSDSSVADRQSKSFDPEEEKKRRERRHRERAHRQLDSKGRPIPSSSRNKRPNHRLDVIDKLDVTSIFGTGGTI